MAFNTDYDGMCQNEIITLKHTTLTKDVHEGRLVKMISNDTVGLAVDNDNFIGVVRAVEKGVCAVGLSGAVELPYTGTAPTVGRARLISNATSGVKIGGATDREYLVVNVSTTTLRVVFFILS